VLPEAEFEDEHLPGAVNVPLKTLNRERARQLDRGRPSHRLLPRLPVKHEPTSRVAARESRLRAGLRLRRRQGRLG
jgi:rhodanese-related sulfurtransferase